MENFFFLLIFLSYKTLLNIPTAHRCMKNRLEVVDQLSYTRVKQNAIFVAPKRQTETSKTDDDTAAALVLHILYPSRFHRRAAILRLLFLLFSLSLSSSLLIAYVFQYKNNNND